MTNAQRVDVHQHFVPPVWAETLARHDPPHPVAPWTEDDALRAMDSIGTQRGILSVTSPGVYLGDASAARGLAREVNEYGAALSQRRPDRFGLFAVLPLPDVDAAVEEAVYALDELHASGVGLLSNVDGRYLGDPMFQPLWQALDNRAAVVHVHPAPTAGLANLPGAAGWVDWPFDTTRTAVHMVINGVMRDFPSVRVILAHAGGFVPYQSGRFESLARITPGQSQQHVHDDLRKFYFDTALSTTPATLAALIEFAGADHILFGSDWPYATLEPAVRELTASLDAYLDERPEWAAKIAHENADSFWPHKVT